MTLLEKAAKAAGYPLCNRGMGGESLCTNWGTDGTCRCRKMVRDVLKAVRPDFQSMDLIRAVATKLDVGPAEVDLAVCAFIDCILAEKP